MGIKNNFDTHKVPTACIVFCMVSKIIRPTPDGYFSPAKPMEKMSIVSTDQGSDVFLIISQWYHCCSSEATDLFCEAEES